jgi:L-lactate dehydrogenase complex protein LldE
MRIGVFSTCLVDVFFPEVGISMVRVLRRLGLDVDFPEGQTCCGQPAFNTGYWEEGRRAAKGLIRALEPYDAVVAPSGSCTAMIRCMYPRLLAEEPEWKKRAEQLSDRCFEFSEFLVQKRGLVDLGARLEGTAVYHHSCHMRRELQVTEAPLQLLTHVRGLTLKELPHKEDCCGFGGTFAVKMGKISTAMVDEKVDHILSTGVDFLVGSDMSCLMNRGGRLSRRGATVQVLHVAQLLDRGLD